MNRKAFLACLALLAVSCRRAPAEPSEPEKAPVAASNSATPRGAAERRAAAVAAAKYVGSDKCQSCHAAQSSQWLGSQHQRAMQLPNDKTVLGDFDNRSVSVQGERALMHRQGASYFVTASGVSLKAGERKSERRDFEVKYTFGVTPLQQYLLDIGDGHLQAFTAAYDTLPKEQHGQHWYDLLPTERIKPGDELHWTSVAYNWNASCADCHSTGLEKRYDPEGRSYETRYSEISVGCEACHGPASEHVAQAERHSFDSAHGLPRSFATQRDRHFEFSGGTPIAHLTPDSRSGTPELESCAFCHSHRADLGGTSLELHDRYRTDWLDAEHYEPDGQARQETFEITAFLQSKMYAAGVVCSDCHHPHSGTLRRPGNALCTGCHQSSVFDTPAHHLHAVGSEASQCVTCHMPTKTYMGIDARRQHRLAVPRPDLTATLGVPNACTETCHSERRRGSTPETAATAAATWAASVVTAHFGPNRAPSFAAGLDAGRKQAKGGRRALLDVLSGPFPDVARAAALSELAAYPETPLAAFVDQGKAPSPLIRRAFAELLSTRPPSEVAALVPLLSDQYRSVRIEAARGLLQVQRTQLSAADSAAIEGVLAELRESLRQNADHAGSLLELAQLSLASDSGPAGRAAARGFFEQALVVEPSFAAVYVNYADYLRSQGKEEEAAALLTRGLQNSHDRAPLEHALGLLWVRRGDPKQGLSHLAEACRLAPDSNALAYVYAVALFDAGRQAQAVALLEKQHQKRPADLGLLELLVSYLRRTGAQERATALEQELTQARKD